MSAAEARVAGRARGPPSDCVFCHRLADPALTAPLRIYSDDLVDVTHWWPEGEETAYLGALVIQSRRHTAQGLCDLTDAEGRKIGELVARLSRVLRDVCDVAWTYTYAFTEGHRHAHQFVVARYRGMPESYARLAATDWPDAPRGRPEDAAALCRSIAERLRHLGG